MNNTNEKNIEFLKKPIPMQTKTYCLVEHCKRTDVKPAISAMKKSADMLMS